MAAGRRRTFEQGEVVQRLVQPVSCRREGGRQITGCSGPRLVELSPSLVQRSLRVIRTRDADSERTREIHVQLGNAPHRARVPSQRGRRARLRRRGRARREVAGSGSPSPRARRARTRRRTRALPPRRPTGAPVRRRTAEPGATPRARAPRAAPAPGAPREGGVDSTSRPARRRGRPTCSTGRRSAHGRWRVRSTSSGPGMVANTPSRPGSSASPVRSFASAGHSESPGKTSPSSPCDSRAGRR